MAEPFTFEFDGRRWKCRDTVPDDVWQELQRTLARQPNRQTRKAAAQVGSDLLAAVVIDSRELAERVNDRDKERTVVYEVLPPLIRHYESQRAGCES